MEASLPRDNNGNYSLPSGYLAVTGQKVLASQHNPPLEDLRDAMTDSYARDGRAPMMGPVDMNGYALLNLGESADPGAPATNAQLDAVIAMVTALIPPGALLPGRWIAAPAGWLLENGGTIGSAASGATTRAHGDTLPLFTHLWNSFGNTLLPIQDSSGAASTRGASAAADFAANKRLPLFDSRTRFLRGADGGLGYDVSLTVGATQADGIKNHRHPGTTDSAGGFTPQIPKGNSGGGDGAQNGPPGGGFISGTPVPPHPHTFTTNDNTGGLALETRPRSSVVLFCIKL
jgi:hypothetical protein